MRGLGARHVWVLDFEFETAHEVLPVPVCMVAHDAITGREVRMAGAELLSAPCPFTCDDSELFVAFYAPAEAHCFLALGWPLPPRWIDLWVEAKRLVNGRPALQHGLLDVMGRYRLAQRDAAHKAQMQHLVGTGQWRAEDLPRIVEYCADDVRDTEALLRAMLPSIIREAPGVGHAPIAQAIIRGRFMAETAAIERRGIPWDAIGWAQVSARWDAMRVALIRDVDRAYGVFQGTTFSAVRFAEYLHREGVVWPRLPGGALALDDATFRQMAKGEPRVAALRELRTALAQMRSTRVAVDDDGRVRTRLRPFASKTSRSQPSATRYPFGNARWMRSFIMPPPGQVFAYLDYRSQEVALAAYLAGDDALADTYASGDPYLAFAKRAGLVPQGGTKQSHPKERAMCKTIVLAVQYGMGPAAMAQRGGLPEYLAAELFQRHQEAYPRFWDMAHRQMDRLGLGVPAYTPLGWRYQIGPGSEINPRSHSNWVIQSTGADIMRLATIRCAEAGLPVVATVHDALAFVVPERDATAMLTAAAAEMQRAAELVAGGPVGVDIHRVEPCERYEDEGGVEFFRRVMALTEDDGDGN